MCRLKFRRQLPVAAMLSFANCSGCAQTFGAGRLICGFRQTYCVAVCVR